MKLCIATPSHSGQVHVAFARSLTDTVKMFTVRGDEVQWRSLSYCSFPHAARERLARGFMASDYTDLLFADADMGWEAGDILEMVLSDVDVVGAICPKRKDPIEWSVNLLTDERGERIRHKGMFEAAYVGTALMRIKRNVFERMPGRYFDAGFEGAGFIGEDAWFCREWRRLGGRVWADPRIKVSHTGPKEWHETYQIVG